MRIIFNFIKILAHITLISLMAYFSYCNQYNGKYLKEFILTINLIFLIIGISLGKSWQKMKRN